MSKELIEAIRNYDYATMNKVEEKGNLDVPSLLAAFAAESTDDRVKMIKFLAGYGTYGSLRADAVAALVELCGDPDHDVFAEAASALVHRVPDENVRDHGVELMLVIEARREDDISAWLAAKLGSARARQMVRERRVAPNMHPVERDLVLGKLGDAEAERASIARYQSVMAPKAHYSGTDTRTWALNMGRMGTATAVLALARDLRHPGVYIYGHGTKFMVRTDVVLGLTVAFPGEPVLQLELTSAEDYARIEAWAVQKFGVTWSSAPPPPYVHLVPAPTYPKP